MVINDGNLHEKAQIAIPDAVNVTTLFSPNGKYFAIYRQ